MTDNYTRLIKDNLQNLYAADLAERQQAIAANLQDKVLSFSAFGRVCRINPHGIYLDDQEATGPMGIILSLYAVHAKPIDERVTPLKAYKEFPNSMPYAGAFTSHAEQILVPHVTAIEIRKNRILESMQGREAADLAGGDVSFIIHPLPKISLCYIFYRADEDFPAAATCLFSNNADQFLPIDGLADLAEYTSKTLIEMLD